MKILHTSDWHIGRQFHNVSMIEDQSYIIDKLLRIVKDNDIDVLIVSGDIYDRSVPPAEAVALLDSVIDRIFTDLKIPFILSVGNHDGAIRMGFAAKPLAEAGIHMVGELKNEIKPIILKDEHGEIAFYALPYADPILVRDVFKVDVHTHEEAMKILTDEIKKDNGSTRRSVVMSHCFISGSEGSDSERPLSVGGAENVPYHLFSDFNYTALGHLHAPQKCGDDNIRYSGSILKYSFSEVSQNKSVTIVDMDAMGNCALEQIPLVAKRDMRIIEGFIDDVLEQAKDDEFLDDYILIRLLDTQALYEPMAKLREYYPNILQLEKPNLTRGGERESIKRENLKKGELPMFIDFYKQMTDDELSTEAIKLLTDTLEHIHKGAE